MPDAARVHQASAFLCADLLKRIEWLRRHAKETAELVALVDLYDLIYDRREAAIRKEAKANGETRPLTAREIQFFRDRSEQAIREGLPGD